MSHRYDEAAHARADERALCRYERSLEAPPEGPEMGEHVCSFPGPRGCGYCRGCEAWADRALDCEREDDD